jgi:hypothetical protein
MSGARKLFPMETKLQLHPVCCERCQSEWLSPTGLDPSIRKEVVKLFSGKDPIKAIKLLRESSGLDLENAKGVNNHMARAPGVCHRCGGSLDGSELCQCSKCHALNYDW